MKGSSTPIPQAQLRSILDRYERPLLQYAARLTGDTDRARDVVQETFIRLCAADRAGVEDHVAAWLFTVCPSSLVIRSRRMGEPSLLVNTWSVPRHRTPIERRCSALVARRAPLRMSSALAPMECAP